RIIFPVFHHLHYLNIGTPPSYTHVFFLRKNEHSPGKIRLKGEIKKRSNHSVTPPQYFHHLAFDYLLLFAFLLTSISALFEYILFVPNDKKVEIYIALDQFLYIFLVLYFHTSCWHL